MNKLLIRLPLLILIPSFNVMATESNIGNMYFIGSVSNYTCDWIARQDGEPASNIIKLGTYTVDEVNIGNGTPVINFTLRALNPDGSWCIQPNNGIDFSWIPASGSWTEFGLQNEGTAKNVAVSLMDIVGKPFNSSYNTFKVGGDGNSAGPFAPFTVNIKKTGIGATAGTVVAAANFAVAYK